MKRWAAIVLWLAATQASAGEEVLKLTVSAPEAGGTNVPVSVKIDMIKELAEAPGERIAVTLVNSDGDKPLLVTGQVDKAKDSSDAVLWWLIPKAEAGEETIWQAKFEIKKRPIRTGYKWEDHSGRKLDLLFEGRPVLRYVYERDTSSRVKTLATTKPFHHVFAPDGKQLLTSGGERGTKYPHHRALFVGWSIGKHNLWAMAESRQPPGTAQVHARHVEMVAGPVMARHTAVINWNGQEGVNVRKLIEETRTVTVFRGDEPSVLRLQIDTILKSLAGDLSLRGDAEHAGVHVRVHNDLARGDLKTAEGDWHTRTAKYLFPGDSKNDRVPGMPWAMMNFMLKGKEYNIQIINGAGSGKKARFSANRPYGRMGSCPYSGVSVKLPAKEPLKLSYRLFIDAGEPQAAEVLNDRRALLAKPPEVEAKWVRTSYE